MEPINPQQIAPENITSAPTPSRIKNFYQKHKVTSISFIVVTSLFIILEIFAGGSAIISCAVAEASPLAGFSIGQCPSDVGSKVLVPQLCNLLLNSQANDICKGSYAIENNNLEVCKQISPQLTTGESYCIQGLAIKNKDIGICDNLSASDGTGDINSRSMCRDAVRYQLFYDGPNKNQYVYTDGQWDPCPGNDPSFWQDGFQQICQIRKNPVMASCQNMQDQEKLDCYLNVAEVQKNPDLCQAFGKNSYGQYDQRTYSCLQQISQATKSLDTCNLIPQEVGAGILDRASCYQNVIGLPNGQLENSTSACNAISDVKNKNNCHALLSYLTAYYGMLYLQPNQRTNDTFFAIRQQAEAKCKPITDSNLKTWCQNTTQYYTLVSGTANEPSDFPN